MDFKQPNIYLCHREPNNGPFLLTIAKLEVNKLSVLIWLQMARMEMGYNLKN